MKHLCWLAAALVAVLVVATPELAAACPACARPEAGAIGTLLIASMIVLPFVVTFVVYRLLRRGGYL